MKNFYLPSFFLIFCCFLSFQAQTQTSLWTEPFDTNTQYNVTLGAEGDDGTADYFFRTNGSNINQTYIGTTGFFFAGQDIDDGGWTGSTSPSQLQWTGISIANYTSLEFTGLWGNASSGIDAADYIIVEYQIDGGGYTKLLEFRNQGGFNATFFEDTNFDGVGNGAGLSSTLLAFTKTIAGTGSFLDLQITISVNGGSEDFAMDELEITGILSASETITTTNVVGDPFCVDVTTGAIVSVEYTTTGTFLGTFTAQLSDATGDFTTPTDIGTGASPIAATIPASTASGTAYRIRVVNDMPATTGSFTSEFEIINGVPEVTGEIAMGGDMQAIINWILPTGCYDEILVVANETAGITFVPTGDGTAYTANTVYAGPDQVVYLGIGTTETVTALINGTTYYFEIFVRRGTTWSSGVEVNVTPDVAPSCEDFTNFPETGSAYNDGTFVGNDGSTWTYVNSSGNQSINGTSPTLGRNQTPPGEMTSGTIAGGIGVLTFNYKRTFSTNVNLEVYVNSILIGNVTTTDALVQMASFTVDVPGNFTLSLLQPAGGGQVTIDDVCWTSFQAPPCVEPMSPPTALNLTADDTSISGDFMGTADAYLVVMSTMSTLSADPVDGTTYAVNDALGGGIVISASNMTTFTASGLSSSTQYYFFVFAYESGCIGEPDYLLTSLDGDATTTVLVTDCFVDDCSFEIVPVAQNAMLDNWSCTSGTYTVNGFCTCDDPSNLWLISPIFDFGNNSILNFNMDIVETFDGSDVKLMYTTNYTGDPSTTTWNLIAMYDANINVSEDISILLNNTTNVVFGIQYLTPNGQAGVSGFELSNIVIESDDCTQVTNPCAITSISTTNTGTCNDNTTPADGTDDYFTVDVVVNFLGAPTTGNLTLTGDVMAGGGVLTAAIGTSPQTFVGVRVPANGTAISITATFDDEMTCTLTNTEAHPGIFNCLPIPWKETFDTAGEGVVGGCTDATDLATCAINNNPSSNGQWSIIAGNGADLTQLTNGSDYFQTVNGVLEARDPGTELCFLSEVIDISSTTVDFSVEIAERATDGSLEIEDYADVYLIIDGTETQIPNWNSNGDTNHTLVGDWATQIVSSGAITGSTLQIKVCVLTNAAAEYITIDNVCVVEAICRIADIAADNIGTCDTNDPAVLTDDFYTADITVTFSTIPTTGTLDLTGDIVGTPPSVDASTLVGTSYTFVGVQLSADGTPIDLTAVFSDDPSCTLSETAVDAGMNPCCAISLVADNFSACDNNGTIGDESDDTFTTDITVTYFNAPLTGNLVLSGDLSATIDVTTITSPYTFVGLVAPANGTTLNVTATFSADMTCTGMTTIPAVAACSGSTLNGGLLVNELGDEAVNPPTPLLNRPEYVELLVISEAANPTLNVNVSGWIIDDNNSITAEFGTTGETAGFLRIASTCLTDVPPGSLIVIYNGSITPRPTNIPADDETDANGDKVYIIPSTSACIEVATAEVLAESDYTTLTITPNATWEDALDFRNSGDVIQLRKPDGTFYHGMAYAITGVTYPTFPNGNSSFTVNTTNNNNNFSYSCGNSTHIEEFIQSTAFTPGAVNNSNNAIIVAAVQDATANYNELIGLDTPTGDCAVPLAVELVNFTATLNQDEVSLKWLTTNEKDNDRFEIEHSTDGQFFKKIGTIASKEDASTTQNYQFVHDNLIEGNNYYRLRMVDLNDKAEYSSIKTVFYQLSEEDILVYPVPAENILYIDCSHTANVAKEITLINTNGKIIKTMQVAEDTPIFELSLQNQPTGLYWIKVVMDTKIITKKIIKQ